MPEQRTLLDGDTGAKIESTEIIAGAVVGGGGGGLIQSLYQSPKVPGQSQDITAAAHVDVQDGTGGGRIEALLPAAVRPDSSFRFSFAMNAKATVLGVGNALELSWRPRLFAPDDPNFPANYNPSGGDVGQFVGVSTFSPDWILWSAIVTQAMISTLTVGNGPVVGRLGMFLQCALSNGAGADTAQLELFVAQGGGGGIFAQRVYLGVEEWSPILVASTA